MELIDTFTAFDWDLLPPRARSLEDTARSVGVSPESLTEWALRGLCPHWQAPDGRPVFDAEEIRQWASQNLAKRIPGKPFNQTTAEPPPINHAATLEVMCGHVETANILLMKSTPPGVYVLTDQRHAVLYVGQSTNPRARVSSHRESKAFSHARMLPVEEMYLNIVEGALIRYWCPPLNKRHPNGNIVAPTDIGKDRDVLALLGILKNKDATAQCLETTNLANKEHAAENQTRQTGIIN